MIKNSDMPAMPTKHNSEHFEHSNHYTVGLTKREHFAAMAMQGIYSDQANHDGCSQESMANEAVKMADALLAALEADNG